MVKQLFIIDGQPLDYNGDQLQMSLPSNLLGKPDDIETAFSYSFTLPRSLGNDRMLAQSWTPNTDAAGVATNKYLSCEYWLDGCKMFDGRLVVNGVNEDGYDCNIFWGMDALRQMSDDGYQLWELGDNTTHQHDYVPSMPSLPADPSLGIVSSYKYYTDLHAQAAWGFAEYDFGVPYGYFQRQDAPLLPTTLPVVTARYILALMTEVYGFAYDFPASADAIIDDLVICLTTKYHYRDDNFPSIAISVNAHEVEDPDSGAITYEHDFAISNAGWGMIGLLPNPWQAGDNIISALAPSHLHNVHVHFEMPTSIGNFTLNSAKFGSHHGINGGSGNYVVDFDIDEIDFGRGDDLRIQIAPDAGVNVRQFWYHVWAHDSGKDYITATISADNEEVTLNQGYPIIPNLPEMTCADFLGELCAICGVALIATNGNTLRFVSWDDLVNAPTPLQCVGINAMSFAVDSLARRNVLTYDTDDWQPSGQDGAIVVDDETLEAENEWWRSHFALPNGRIVPNYSINKDDEIEVNDPIERIALIETGTYGVARITSTGLDFGTLIANNYTAMSHALWHPKVYTITAHLLPHELKAIDFGSAVYVAQIGSYCAVLSITSNEGDIYELEIIKL